MRPVPSQLDRPSAEPRLRSLSGLPWICRESFETVMSADVFAKNWINHVSFLTGWTTRAWHHMSDLQDLYSGLTMLLTPLWTEKYPPPLLSPRHVINAVLQMKLLSAMTKASSGQVISKHHSRNCEPEIRMRIKSRRTQQMNKGFVQVNIQYTGH